MLSAMRRHTIIEPFVYAGDPSGIGLDQSSAISPPFP